MRGCRVGRLAAGAVLLAACLMATACSGNNSAGEDVFEALEVGDVDGALALLAEHPHARYADADGDTLVHWAVYLEDLALARQLIENGADLNAENHDDVKPLDLVMALTVAAASMGESVRELERLGLLLHEHGARSESWEEFKDVQEQIQDDIRRQFEESERERQRELFYGR